MHHQWHAALLSANNPLSRSTSDDEDADKPKHPPPNHSTGSSSGGGGGGKFRVEAVPGNSENTLSTVVTQVVAPRVEVALAAAPAVVAAVIVRVGGAPVEEALAVVVEAEDREAEAMVRQDRYMFVEY